MASSINRKLIFVLLLATASTLLQAVAAQVPVKPAPVPARLYDELKSSDAARRRAALNQFGALRAQEATAKVAAALSDKDASVREAAAFALGQIADRKATEPLMRASEDKEAEVRSSAIFALGMLGDRRAVQAISDALDDESAAVRSSALVALGLMKDSEGVDEVIEMLNDVSFDPRYDAAWALGQIAEPDAIEHLRAALVSLDSIGATAALREAYREMIQNSIDNIEYVSEPPTRPRRATEGATEARASAERASAERAERDRSMKAASIRQSVRPLATERAAQAKVAGAVALRVLVGVDGRPVRAYVTRRLGYGLDQRAVQAALQYRFNPAMQAGLPQVDWVDMEVKF